jgi:hypothetical protein
MAGAHRRYSKEELARRGNALYASDVQPHLKATDNGKFVAIDIETSAYEIAVDELAACERLRSHVPDAQIWLVRIGSRYLYRFGSCAAPEDS